MRNRELIDAITATTKYPRAAVARIVRETFRQVQKGIKRDEKVGIRDFGSFRVKKTRGKSVQDFQTGERVKLASAKVVKFTPSRSTARMTR